MVFETELSYSPGVEFCQRLQESIVFPIIFNENLTTLLARTAVTLENGFWSKFNPCSLLATQKTWVEMGGGGTCEKNLTEAKTAHQKQN